MSSSMTDLSSAASSRSLHRLRPRLNEMGCWILMPSNVNLHTRNRTMFGAFTCEYWPERVKMMQAWADYLDELRDAGESSRCDARMPKSWCRCPLTAKTGVRVP
jgi:hypothetical protein